MADNHKTPKINALDIMALSPQQCIRLVNVLEQVLNSRKHVRMHLGEEVTVPGTLSKALKLPELIKKMVRYKNTNFEPYHGQLEGIWISLSEDTRTQVLGNLGVYDVENMAWDDPRSNRKSALLD